MFAKGLTTYGSFDFLYTDTSDIKDKATADSIRTLFKQSPAMAMKLNIDEMRRTMTFTGTRNEDPITYALLNDCVTERPLIIMDAGLSKYLTEREMRAIFEHELSHIVHGDLDRPADTGLFLNNLDMELAADARAASIVGACAMRGALCKTITYLAQYIAIEYGDPIEEVIKVLMESEDFKTRLDALA